MAIQYFISHSSVIPSVAFADAQSIHFLVKCHNFISPKGKDTVLGIRSLICTVMSMFNIVLAHVNYFQDV